MCSSRRRRARVETRRFTAGRLLCSILAPAGLPYRAADMCRPGRAGLACPWVSEQPDIGCRPRGQAGCGASASPEKATVITIVSKTARCSDLTYQSSSIYL
jgi:hypothetical protein